MALAQRTQLVMLVPAPVPVRMPVDMRLLLEVAMVVVRRHTVAVVMVDIIPLATNDSFRRRRAVVGYSSFTHTLNVDFTSNVRYKISFWWDICYFISCNNMFDMKFYSKRYSISQLWPFVKCWL